MATANDIIKIAQSQVGTYATAVKKCKYNTWYYGSAVSGSGYDWCEVFVQWVFDQAGASSLLYSKTANCGYAAKAFQDRGRLVTSGYKAGDVVFFHWSNERSTLVPGTYVSDHVGIIKSVNSNGTYTTIEGNTGGGYGAVLEQTRYASQISCAGRPDYSGSSSGGGSSSGDYNPNITYRVRTMKKGWLPAVKNLEDYAGIENDAITAITMSVDKGSVWYQVYSGGKWLNKITGCSTTDSSKYAGYSANDKPITGLRVYYKSPKSPYYEAKYRVSVIGSTGYYDYQYDDDTTNGMDGYAGDLKKSIDKVEISLVKA